MKLAVSLLAVLSLVGPATFAQSTKNKQNPPPKKEQSAPAPKPAAPAPKPAQSSSSSSHQSSSSQSSKPAQSQPAPKPAQQQSSKPATQPAQKPAQQQSSKPATQPAQKPAEKPAQQQSSKPATQPAQKPAEKPAQQQSSKPATQPAQKPATQPAQKPATQPAQKPATQPAQKPATQPAQKPAEKPSTPVASKPLSPKAQQKQQEVKQKQATQTAEVKAKVNPQVAAKIPAGASAKINKNNTITVKDPKTGTTKVIDATTGKQRMSYNKNTGVAVYTPKSGVTTVVKGNQTVRTGKGYKEVVTVGANGTKIKEVSVRGAVIKQQYTSKNTYITNKTVIINNKTYIVNENRTYVRNYYPGYGYVAVYTPGWWGSPYVMAGGWVVGGRYVYGSFFAYPGYVPYVGYVSPWWGPVGFVAWSNPWRCEFGCWAGYYRAWNWGWYADAYYAGFYTPYTSYRSLGYFLADYYYQRELESERLARLAAEEDAEYRAEVAAERAANAVAINSVNAPVSEDTKSFLVKQTEEIVASIKDGKQLYASDMVEKGHLFTVDESMSETVTVGDNQYDCKLTAGDLLMRDPRNELDVEPVLDDAQNPVINEETGEPETTTYVTMYVKASKKYSCATGSNVVVQMDALQGMLGEEVARVQEGMEKAVELNIH